MTVATGNSHSRGESGAPKARGASSPGTNTHTRHSAPSLPPPRPSAASSSTRFLSALTPPPRSEPQFNQQERSGARGRRPETSLQARAPTPRPAGASALSPEAGLLPAKASGPTAGPPRGSWRQLTECHHGWQGQRAHKRAPSPRKHCHTSPRTESRGPSSGTPLPNAQELRLTPSARRRRGG